jgi:uncharacterized lipoprotein YmbA
MISRRGFASLAGLGVLAACTSPNPVLYTLAAIPGPVQPVAPRVIRLRTLGLARYLERPQIVRSSEDFHLDVLSNDWWGEPLGAMLGRILVAELTQRLPASTVFLDSGAISATPDVTVEINIERLDQDASGQLILSAQIATSGRHTGARSVRFTVTPPNATTTGFASGVSTAVAQLADTVAAMVAG